MTDSAGPDGRASVGGSCLCGAVRLRASLPSKWVAHCHCSRCRRAHGAAFVTWIGFEADRVQVDDPDGALRWFVAETGAGRAFCSHCGSPMFFRSEQWPGELHVARALLTDEPDRQPQAHVFYDTHVPWVTLGDDLPRAAGAG